MELSLNRITTEKWEVSTCPCGTEPKLEEYPSKAGIQYQKVSIRCPRCGRESKSQQYTRYTDTVRNLNPRYNAIIMAITSWENLGLPEIPEDASEYCRKCKGIDRCIDHAINHPNDAIRCPCYGLLKLCVERSKENAED